VFFDFEEHPARTMARMNMVLGITNSWFLLDLEVLPFCNRSGIPPFRPPRYQTHHISFAGN
jgi:hypothetical protein